MSNSTGPSDRGLERFFSADSETARWIMRILESIPDGLTTLDREWRYTYVNSQTERMLGRPRADLLGKCLWDEFPAVVGTEIEGQLRRVSTESVTSDFEGHNAAWDRWYENRAFPMPDGGVAVHFRDITDRKRAEAALRESEERFRSYFELGLIGMAITSPTKGCLAVNDEICLILGYERAELLTKTWAEMTYPDDLAADVLNFDRVMAGEIDDYTMDKRWVRKDGRVIDATISVKFLRRADGSVDYFVALLQDITERKRAEAALKRQNEILQTIFDHIPVMINFIDVNSQATLVNRHWEEVLGWSQKEAMSRDLVPEFYPNPQDAKCVREYVRNPPPGWTNFKTRTHDGRVLDTSWSLVVLSDGSRIGFGRDITEQTQVEEALRQTRDELGTHVLERTAELALSNEALHAEIRERQRVEKARTELLRRLATAEEDERRRLSRELHDQVGQDIISLTLGLKALRDGGQLPKPEQGLLERLQKIAEEIGREVHDLALRLRPTALDDLGLLAALQSAVEEWSRRAGVEADFHSSGLEGRRLPGEVETALYRVVLEALHNVLKHARACSVSVILDRRDNYAVAIVEDDGIGFDAEAAMTGEPTGRFGLISMRERVALVGGTLETESTPGAGTTIFARIPLPPMEEGDQP